jgi:dimethylamine/trimethylamine dehydrogenase
LEDTIEAIGDTCAVAIRFTADELTGPGGATDPDETRDIVEIFAEMPDLWDVNMREWRHDSVSSRFGAEGWQEDLVSFVKKVTSKPVVGVGRFTSPDSMVSQVRRGVLDFIGAARPSIADPLRFTSPDSMVSQVRRGVLDFIGAARPSIADPFLPKKIEEGRVDEIRECIGCNICVSADFTIVPMRCTQNPTMGEEWRKGWHPETIPPKESDDNVLIVGAGPAGLECARALGQRGYHVTLAEAGDELGGRVTRESRLPGLNEWARVRDYRTYQIARMANVEVYRGSRMIAEQVIEFGTSKIIMATGATWRRDGVGRQHWAPIPGCDRAGVYTPDDVMDEHTHEGPVVIYDDDHYYMGSVIAEKLCLQGLDVKLITPAADVAAWSRSTLEFEWNEQRLHEIGVTIIEKFGLVRIGDGEVEIEHTRSGRRRTLPCGAVVLVTMRLPNDALYHELKSPPAALADAGINSVVRIGDCLAPSTIAAAVYAGHQYAREIHAAPTSDVPFKREMPAQEIS